MWYPPIFIFEKHCWKSKSFDDVLLIHYEYFIFEMDQNPSSNTLDFELCIFKEKTGGLKTLLDQKYPRVLWSGTPDNSLDLIFVGHTVLVHNFLIFIWFIFLFQVWCRKQLPEFKAKSKHWKTMWLKLHQKFLLKLPSWPSKIKEWFNDVMTIT